jgi:hypothetical protein
MVPPPTDSSGKGVSLCPLPVIRSKGEQKDFGSYADNPDEYIQAFITVIQTFELAWKNIMLLQDQTISSLKKQQVLIQATQIGDDFHLQHVPIPMGPGNEGIEIPMPMGAQVVPLVDPPLGSK